MRALALLSLTLTLVPAISQQIRNICQTTRDQSHLFKCLTVSSPINFVIPGAVGIADIVIRDDTKFQSIAGFGGSLTESSALVLNDLKSKNSTNYWNLLGYMFGPTNGESSAGLNYLRVAVGSSDSTIPYSLDDTSGDTKFSNFNISRTPSYVFSVLRDIQSVNNALKVHLTPSSPPGWMKDSGTMNGGSLQSRYVGVIYATYLLKAVQGFRSKGFSIYAISIQSEPQNSNSAYPSCTMTPAVEGRIATALRSLLNSNSLSSVKVIGFEGNWDNADAYAVQLMDLYGNAYAGVAFHCYAGSVSDQEKFHSAYPVKAIYFTECSGTFGSDWWSDVKWYMDNLWIGSLEHFSQSGLMWTIALDGSSKRTQSCGQQGCQNLVTVNGNGSHSFTQEFYSMAQASKAVIPNDSGGPFGQRIGISVGASLSGVLRVGAYVTGRVSSSDWVRYSIVVLNMDDSAANSQPVKTTIEFRGLQATYSFPVGVTTLWWFAPARSSADVVVPKKDTEKRQLTL